MNDSIVNIFNKRRSIESIEEDIRYKAFNDEEISYLKEFYIYEVGFYNDIKLYIQNISKVLYNIYKEEMSLNFIESKIDNNNFDILKLIEVEDKVILKILINNKEVFISDDYISTDTFMIKDKKSIDILNKILRK